MDPTGLVGMENPNVVKGPKTPVGTLTRVPLDLNSDLQGSSGNYPKDFRRKEFSVDVARASRAHAIQIKKGYRLK